MNSDEMNYTTKTTLFECSCHSPEHMIVMKYDDFGVGEKFMQISVQLYMYKNFFQRVFAALKYVFLKKKNSCYWDSTILEEKDMVSLEEFLKLRK